MPTQTWMVCRLLKRNGRYVIGPLSTTTKTLPEAMTQARRQANSARWRRIIPKNEIEVSGAAVIRAWETHDGGGIAVTTNDPKRIPGKLVDRSAAGV